MNRFPTENPQKGKNPKGKNQSWRVVPLGVNMRPFWLSKMRALARCSGMSWSEFVQCAVIDAAGAVACKVNVGFHEVEKLSRSTQAKLGQRMALLDDVAGHSGGYSPDRN